MIENYHRSFGSLFCEANQPGVLEVVFVGPNGNAVGTDIRTGPRRLSSGIDQNAEVRALLIRGVGKVVSS